MSNSKIQVIENTSPVGMYIWVLPSGEPFGDGDGNLMNIESMYGDVSKQRALAKAAVNYGAPEGGKAVFQARRRITDDELSHQVARLAAGLVPDPLDPEAIMEAQEFASVRRNFR